jgi:hypothetical protein
VLHRAAVAASCAPWRGRRPAGPLAATSGPPHHRRPRPRVANGRRPRCLCLAVTVRAPLRRHICAL